jgi:type IV pilus assembly protein PilF
MQTQTDDDHTGEAGQSAGGKGSPADVYTNLAVAYMKEDRMDVALGKIKQAVKADPRDSNAHNVMALIYQRLAQEALAEKHFKRAISLDKRNFYALNAFGSYLCGRKRYGEAYGHFDQAVVNPLNRNKEIALANAGICAYKEGKRELADTYLRKALNANPRHHQALAQMAEVSYDAGDYGLAQSYLKRYSAIARHTPATLWTGVRTERKLGGGDQEASYRLLLKNRFPDSNEVRMLRDLDKQL